MSSSTYTQLQLGRYAQTPPLKRLKLTTTSERVGRSSEYIEGFLDGMLQPIKSLVTENTDYLIYQYAGLDGWLGEVSLKRAPKFEWYLPREDGSRPLYRWGQSELFQHAGAPMPEVLIAVAQRIEAAFGESVNHAIAIDYIDGVKQHAPPHQDKQKGLRVKPSTHLDMNADSSFFVFSFGAARKFTLQTTNKIKLSERGVVWEKPLCEGSLLRISARDNRELYHAVHKAGKSTGRRWSLIFRNIDTHVPIDLEREAEANRVTTPLLR